MILWSGLVILEMMLKNLTYEIFNKEILIMGFGRIGKILIKRCLGFDMV